MGSKTSSQQQNQSTTSADPQAVADYNRVIRRATQVSNTPYNAYTGELTAGVNNQENTATAALNGLGAAANGYYSAAAGQSGLGAAAVNPTAINGSTISQYESPYQSDVINSTLATINQQNAQQQQQLTSQAIGSGAFGGDRAGVAAAALAGQQDLAKNQTIAGLNNQNFSQALGEANTQQATTLSADQANRAAIQQNAATLAGIGSAATSSGLGVAGAQLGAGELQQQTAQAADTAAYGQFQQQQAFPYQQEQYLANIVEGIAPNYGSSTSGSTSTETSPLNSIIGGGIALGGLLSDRRAKEGLEKVGKMFDGQPIYRFRYKGRPETHLGLVAQEVEKKHPGAIGSLGDLKTVDYDAATRTAADKGHFAAGGGVGSAGFHTLHRDEVAHLERASGGSVGSLGSTPYADVSGYVPSTGAQAVAHMLSAPQQQQSATPESFGSIPNFSQYATAGKDLGNLGSAVGSVGNYIAEGGVNSLGVPFADGGKVIGLGAARLERRGYDGGGVVGADALLFDPNAVGYQQAVGDGLGPASLPSSFAAAANAPAPLTPAPGLGAAAVNDNKPVPVAPAPTVTPILGYRQNDGTITPTQDGLGAAQTAPPTSGGVAAINTAAPPSQDPMGGFMNRVRQIESSGNDNAVSGAGATGRYQFMPGTWADVAAKHPELGLTSNGISDPGQQDAAMRALTADNSAALTKALGREPTPGELYLAHQQGVNGAIGLITNPNARASDIVGERAITSNGGSPDMSASQFAGMWNAKLNGSGGLPPSALGYSGTNAGLGAAQTPATPATNGLVAANAALSPGLGAARLSDNFGSLLGGTGKPGAGHSGGLLGLFPGMSDDERMALMAAGLGMAASPSKSVGVALGQGGLQGISTLQAQQKLGVDRARAQTEATNVASEAGYRQGELGLGSNKINLAAQELRMNLEKMRQMLANDSARVANETADTAARTKLQGAETVAKLQTPTMAGVMVTDPSNPSAPPKLVPYNSLPQAGADGATKPQAAASAPVVDPSGYTHPPSNTPINPMTMTPQGQQLAMDNAKETMEGARTAYEASQSQKFTLDQMQHEFSSLPQTGFLASGPGQQERAHVVNSLNSVLKTLGVGNDNLIAPGATGATEDLKKLTVRMGQDLAKSLGGREPGFIVQQSVGAVPSSENSPMGFQRIVAGLRAAAQRNEDRFNFLTEYQTQHGGDVTGADDLFNKLNPPSRYVGQAVLSTVDPRDLAALKSNPKFAPLIDKKYGAGTSSYAMGQ